MLIKGLRKQEPVLIVKRLILTADLLSQCIHTLRLGYLSPFFGFLCCSKFAPSAFNPVIHPSLSDITAHTPDSLIYTLKKSLESHFPFTIFAPTPSSVLMNFRNTFFPDMTIIHLLKNHSFLQKMGKWPQFGLTNTFKIFSAPSPYLPNTTPSIPSRLEQPRQPPA